MRKTTLQDVIKVIWRVCDTFRGTMDSSKYKDYILTMLFVKYISDLNSKCIFNVIYENRNAENIGEIINEVLIKIENDNKEKLAGVFRNIDFNSEAELGRTKERNAALKHLIEDFADESLDLRPSMLNDSDVIGDAYEFLIANFASDAGKKGGEFYTPAEVSVLLAKLAGPKDGNKIYDPTCGSGSLLIKAAKEVKTDNFKLYGQERNGQTQALAKMNMFLHKINDSVIEWGDTLRNPLHLENERLMKFDIIVSNPPFSLNKWGAEDLKDDIYGRFEMGMPPKSKGDYAFIEHILASLNEEGTAAIILPHGVLFRGGSEGKIRKHIIENNLLDAVIGLPENLFFGTAIPACILVFKKNKADKSIVFIDGSRDFDKGKNQNVLRDEDIKKITGAYSDRKKRERYCHVASFEEVKENDFNLNIPRYVDTFEEKENIDLDKIKVEIDEIENELLQAKLFLKEALEELDL